MLTYISILTRTHYFHFWNSCLKPSSQGYTVSFPRYISGTSPMYLAISLVPLVMYGLSIPVCPFYLLCETGSGPLFMCSWQNVNFGAVERYCRGEGFYLLIQCVLWEGLSQSISSPVSCSCGVWQSSASMPAAPLEPLGDSVVECLLWGTSLWMIFPDILLDTFPANLANWHHTVASVPSSEL